MVCRRAATMRRLNWFDQPGHAKLTRARRSKAKRLDLESNAVCDTTRLYTHLQNTSMYLEFFLLFDGYFCQQG